MGFLEISHNHTKTNYKKVTITIWSRIQRGNRMGQGITIECQSCEYIKTFSVGVGFRYSSLERVINLVSSKRREKVLDILHNQDVHEVDYRHKLFQCPKCYNLESHFDFSIIYNNNKKYAPYFRCHECRTKLDPVREPIKNIPCPICGRNELTQYTTLFWD